MSWLRHNISQTHIWMMSKCKIVFLIYLQSCINRLHKNQRANKWHTVQIIFRHKLHHDLEIFHYLNFISKRFFSNWWLDFWSGFSAVIYIFPCSRNTQESQHCCSIIIDSNSEQKCSFTALSNCASTISAMNKWATLYLISQCTTIDVNNLIKTTYSWKSVLHLVAFKMITTLNLAFTESY